MSPNEVPLADNYLADSNVKPRADAEDAALATQLWAEFEERKTGWMCAVAARGR